MNLHPIAKLFPSMPPEDFEAFKADIKANGVLIPVLVHEGQILDGRHRWRACDELGIECPTQVWNGKDAWMDAQSLNLMRRHLPQGQVVAIRYRAADLHPEVAAQIQEPKAEAKERQSEGQKSGGRGKKKTSAPHGAQVSSPKRAVDSIASLLKTSARTVQRVEHVKAKAPEMIAEIADGKKTVTEAIREIKRAEIIQNLESVEKQEAKAIEGVYDVIVIDPPWPMKKIERDVTPNQVEFEYPTMGEAEIGALEVPCAKDCHVWLWTTQKYLPMALRLLDTWGLAYTCAFVWHKPGGFQPFGMPQFNCEFALYARKGTPQFVDTKAFNLCFDAPRGAHSEKPKEFYEVVRRVTAGRRLDMFNRRKIEGFDGWGNESE